MQQRHLVRPLKHWCALLLWWCIAAAAGALVLSACGGGGSSDGNAGSGAPSGVSRSGVVTYRYINKVYGVDMASGRTRVLLEDDYSGYLVGVAAGPGGAVAVASNSSAIGPTSTLAIRNAAGTTESQTRYQITIESLPTFSADGSKLAFTAGVYTGSTLRYSVQVVARDGTALYFFRNFDAPAWLPDGRLVIRSVTDGKLYLTNQDPLQALSLLPNSEGALRPAVSPDGSKVAYLWRASAQDPRHIYMMNINGSGRRQVTASAGSGETSVMFSPSGQELLVTSYGCVPGGTSPPVGSADDDLMHVISADAQSLAIDINRNAAATRLLDENGQSRCASSSLSWR